MPLEHAPLKKREESWSRNVSRKWFWDCCWGSAAQLLANYVFPFHCDSPRSLCEGLLGPASFSILYKVANSFLLYDTLALEAHQKADLAKDKAKSMRTRKRAYAQKALNATSDALLLIKSVFRSARHVFFAKSGKSLDRFYSTVKRGRTRHQVLTT